MVDFEQLQLNREKLPKHIAIIMDGNGRWAKLRGMPRNMGHRQGMVALEKVIEFCAEIEIPALTVYAFSTENWKRSTEEVSLLMNLLVEFANKKVETIAKNNIVIRVLGDLEGLPEKAKKSLYDAVERTKFNTGMKLNIAINYGSRLEIIRATKMISEKVKNGELNADDIDEKVIEDNLYTHDLPEVDFLIRSSGEQRVSNFLLWQIAYSEMYFSNVLWPDFDKEEMIKALKEFETRQRRFGAEI